MRPGVAVFSLFLLSALAAGCGSQPDPGGVMDLDAGTQEEERLQHHWIREVRETYVCPRCKSSKLVRRIQNEPNRLCDTSVLGWMKEHPRDLDELSKGLLYREANQLPPNEPPLSPGVERETWHRYLTVTSDFAQCRHEWVAKWMAAQKP